MSKEPDISTINDEGIQSGANNPYAEEEKRRLFEREEGKHKRDQATRRHIHKVSVLGLWVFALISFCFTSVWAWHLLTPIDFVTPEQLDTIEAVLLSIVGSSFFTGLARNWLSARKD